MHKKLRNLLSLCLIVSLLSFLSPVIFAADTCGVDWQWANPLPQGNDLNSVTYGNGKFVAVGDSGTILMSGDGTSWTAASSSGTSYHLNGVIYGNNRFVAVGGYHDLESDSYLEPESYKPTIVTSVNGTSWTAASFGTSYSLFDVTYGNNRFVAVGYAGTILTSVDGISWTPASSGTSDSSLFDVTYDNNRFVVVGEAGTILTSVDGISWTQRSSGTSYSLEAVTYGNNRFVAVGYAGILTSVDGGTSWTAASSVTSYSLFSWGVTYGNNRFVAVGYAGTILTSVDGTSWTASSPGISSWLEGVTYGNNRFVAVGEEGTILTSGDGISWTQRSSGTTKTFNGVTYGNNRFVAVGESGTILTSGDGTSWTAVSSGTSYSLWGVTYGNNRFVAVGSDGFSGKILTSIDGTSWNAASSGTSSWLNNVTYGNNLFVAVGDYGKILTSGDGTSWTAASSGTSYDLSAVTYGNNRFVAVGEAGILTSVDGGTSWTAASSGVSEGVTYGNNRFVAVGSHGTILTSVDGSSWTAASSGIVFWLGGVIYGNNRFVAVGYGGKILMSFDGTAWTAASSGIFPGIVSPYLNGVIYGNNRFVAVGSGGTILTSQCGGANTTQQLTVSKAGTGSGTITSSPAGINCGSQCSKYFNRGEFLMLTATPSAGSTFTGWSGGVCSGSLTTCNLTMDAAKSVTATFNLNSNNNGTAHLINISTRAQVGTNLDNMIAGFAVSGSGELKLVMRSLGKGLNNYGVATNLNSKFDILTYPARSTVASNDDWGNSTAKTELQTSNQAPPDATDAATILSMPTGIYTTEVKPTSKNGIGLVEVFEAPNATGNARLINISTRSFVGSGLQNQIAGFGISGSGTLKLAARALGQGLVARGVPTNLDARIQVYTYPDRKLLAENDSWQSGASASELQSKGINPPHATDAALILNLAAGVYTVEVVPLSTSGIGLIELFEVAN